MDLDDVLGLTKRRGVFSPMGYAISTLIAYIFLFFIGLIIFIGGFVWMTKIDSQNIEGLTRDILMQYSLLLLFQLFLLVSGLIYSIRLVSKLKGEVALSFILVSLALLYLFYNFYAMLVGFIVTAGVSGTSESGLSAGLWLNFSYFLLLVFTTLSCGRIHAMKEAQEPEKKTMWPYGRTKEKPTVIPAITKATVNSYEDVPLAECPMCKRRIPGDSLFCPYCGTAFNRAKAVCGSCGEAIPPDAVVCPYCGAKLR